MTRFRLSIIAVFSLILWSVVLVADNEVDNNFDRASSATISDNDYFRKNPAKGIVKLPNDGYYQALEDLNLNQSDVGLEVEAMADGSERVNLQGRFMMHSAVIHQDGQVKHICGSVMAVDHVKPVIKRAVQ